MDNDVEMQKWARLLASFGIIFGMLYLVVGNIPNPAGLLNGVKADLMWPSIILLVAAVAVSVTSFASHAARKVK